MSKSRADDWEELATALHERGGVPERRAQVVALVATGHSHSEAQEALGLPNRSTIAQHVKLYRDRDRPTAEWLAENGPEV